MNDSNYLGFELESEFGDPIKARLHPIEITTTRHPGIGYELEIGAEIDWDLILELWERGMQGKSTKVKLVIRVTDTSFLKHQLFDR